MPYPGSGISKQIQRRPNRGKPRDLTISRRLETSPCCSTFNKSFQYIVVSDDSHFELVHAQKLSQLLNVCLHNSWSPTREHSRYIGLAALREEGSSTRQRTYLSFKSASKPTNPKTVDQ